MNIAEILFNNICLKRKSKFYQMCLSYLNIPSIICFIHTNKEFFTLSNYAYNYLISQNYHILQTNVRYNIPILKYYPRPKEYYYFNDLVSIYKLNKTLYKKLIKYFNYNPCLL